MRKLIDIIVFVLFWGIPLFFLQVLLNRFGFNKFTIVIFPAFLICFLLSISYKKIWSFDLFTSKKKISAFLAAVLSLFIILIYVNAILYRSNQLFDYFSNSDKKRGWKGKVHQSDSILGFKPIPNARGFHTFPLGDNIPMAYDGNGFRIPLSDSVSYDLGTRLDLLFLGCSYTYGDACLAEETFPYTVSKKTNLTYINAGVCSYGLSHMLIQAEKLIPTYRPRYVVVQYSPWLIHRATSLFAPIYYGSLPNPYFFENKGEIELHPPIYETQIFDLDAEQINRNSKFSFFIKKGFLFYLKEDFLFLNYKFKFLLGLDQGPTNNLAKAEIYAYNKIIELAKKNNSQVIILILGMKNKSTNIDNYISHKNVNVANADSLLNVYLKLSGSKEYIREFGNWRFTGTDSINIDIYHPNPKAHKIIARSITELLINNH